jgi:hypothetical protein
VIGPLGAHELLRLAGALGWPRVVIPARCVLAGPLAWQHAIPRLSPAERLHVERALHAIDDEAECAEARR